MHILALETSCDETAAAVLQVNGGQFKLLSNIVSSQVKVHAKFGGVIPEVAARLHLETILPIIEKALQKANVTLRCEVRKHAASKGDTQAITHIAVTTGPGLVSSLMVGVETAKTLAFAYNLPLIKVNHIEGHLLSAILPFPQNKSVDLLPSVDLLFPVVALIVSGGHTQIILVKDYLKYKLIGQTRDDAAGEAFDKVAKILNLGYPGGPAVAKAAKLASHPSTLVTLPRPMINSKDYDMSFSGLKTAVLYAWRDLKDKTNPEDLKVAIASEFQQAVTDVLIAKTMKAVTKLKAKTLILGGGVSANNHLRDSLSSAVKTHNCASPFPVSLLLPEKSLTGDNAAMIALAAYYHIQTQDFIHPFKLKSEPAWELVL